MDLLERERESDDEQKLVLGGSAARSARGTPSSDLPSSRFARKKLSARVAVALSRESGMQI